MLTDFLNTVNFVLFLSLVNLSPPLLAFFFGSKYDAPLDGGRKFWDGRPLLGPHKTIRGVLGGVVTGVFISPFFGWGILEGTALAILSMLGDLITSFIKRRANLPSGSVVIGGDQFLECVMPALFWKYKMNISLFYFVIAVTAFSSIAYAGSIFFKKVLLSPPCNPYPRPLHPRLRFREWKSCQIRKRPWTDVFHFEDALYYHTLLYMILRILGIYEIGVRNALSINTNRVSFFFPDLPVAFDGYRILFMTDLHLDGHPRITDNLRKSIEKIDHVDLCVLGGDYRFETVGDFAPAVGYLKSLLPLLTAKARDGVIAVLGNHDCIEIEEAFRNRGLKFLVNDHVIIKRGNEALCFAGVDDPHYYRCADVGKALRGTGRDLFTVLISHSPEVYKEAHRFGVNLYLCGHTHAGQFSLPRVGPVFTHSRTGRRFHYGKWQYGGMQGYTSSGVGASGLFARYGTRGEIVIITLRCLDRERISPEALRTPAGGK
ncbi:CDP-archaeol synthase [Thermodesulforhabdus norvegica]|uniref:Calcineurin-like phosphoesterase domain-containing protein n=1 Tax=Thermodesulforhabdus norvegica TaxID=39841 RepID=A0A1I4R0M9_9BACT|nr:CDP-archaeol synthase [Thermodesulforhabdus norvegica]SFM45801.1 hypothetical protein SAMN05660836_00328 [Thermodesulforhabdus norvegica]